MQSKFFILLTLALVFGLGIFWIDSQPTWDDAGITAAMIIGVTAILGFLLPKRAWVWGLAVGVWIPIWQFAQTENPFALLVLVFAFIGAYGGALIRKVSIFLRDTKP